MNSPTPNRSFIDLSPSEREALLTAELEKEVKRTFDAGLYITYTNELCISDDLFIREYKNGQRQLVKVITDSATIEIIQDL